MPLNYGQREGERVEGKLHIYFLSLGSNLILKAPNTAMTPRSEGFGITLLVPYTGAGEVSLSFGAIA